MGRFAYILLVTLALIQYAMAFLPARLPAIPAIARGQLSSRSSSTRKRASALTMAKDYWEGEWVCADCGYIYDAEACGGKKFEDQK